VRIKPLVRVLHRVLAAAVGVPLMVLAVTGALLVFPEPIGRAVHGDRVADPYAPTRPASELIAAAHAALPPGDRVVRLQYPKAAGDAIDAQTKGERLVVLDPGTARVLRVVEPGGFDLHRVLVRLHVNLFAGETGEWVTAAAATALILLCVSGVYLWWPRGRWARHYFAVKWRGGGPRRTYDLHRAGGLYSSAVLVVIAFTGVVMSFYGTITPAIYRLTGSSPRPTEPKTVAVRAGVKPLSPDAAVTVARSHLPGTDVYRLYPPKSADAPYRVFLLPDHDRGKRLEETRLVIDSFTGAVLSEDGPRTHSAGDTAMRWLLPLHFGTFGGTATRVVWLVVSLSPVLLAATGFLIWQKRFRARRAAAAVRRATAAPACVPVADEPVELAGSAEMANTGSSGERI
jgi:uncharacterized iron-regulated membrane protein